MKLISLVALFSLGNLLVAAQKPSEKKEAPQQYFSESGQPLAVKETRDKNGVLTERAFTRQADGGLDNKELYTNGKISETDYFGSDGKMTFKTKFNNKGEAIETIFYESSGEISSRSTHSYDSNGNGKTESFRKDGSKKSSETLDSDMRIVELINYKPDGRTSSTERCKYDGKISECKKTECTRLDGDGKLLSKTAFDHNTRVKEETKYFTSGKPREIQILENAYTTNERIKDWTIYDEDGSYRTQKMERFKLENGVGMSKPVEVNYYSMRGELLRKDAFKYDARGNELERRTYDAQGRELKN